MMLSGFQLSAHLSLRSLLPAKRLGKGQVCKGEDTKSWGSHKEAATPTKINLSWGGRKAPAAVPGANVGLGRQGRPPGPGSRTPLPARAPGT